MIATQVRGGGFKRIDQMLLDDNNERMFFVQGKIGGALTRCSHVLVNEAIPAAGSSRAMSSNSKKNWHCNGNIRARIRSSR